MAAQSDHGPKSSPVYEADQAMLRLLQQQHARHMPQPLPPPSLSSTTTLTPNSSSNNSTTTTTNNTINTTSNTTNNTANTASSTNSSNNTNTNNTNNNNTNNTNTNNTNTTDTATHRSPVAFAPAESQDAVRRPAREVVPCLPRSQTLKRQQSERRDNLTPAEMLPQERRVPSSDVKSPFSFATSGRDVAHSFATPSAYGSAYGSAYDHYSDLAFSATSSPIDMEHADDHDDFPPDDEPPRKAPIPVPTPDFSKGVVLIPGTNLPDTTNMPPDEYDALIQSELENVWILNLSMHFRDRSKREKFFVTYRERDTIWRRVTISLDYRLAPPDSLEGELSTMKLQRDKSAKIYEAIRDSLPDIQFYDTATNLKLQTSDGRLHVHVVEDGNEKIDYPRADGLQYLNCWLVKESDIAFDSHISGFVYKVRVNGEVFVKKEVPGSETVEEFLYEIHALHSLQFSNNVIRFRGLVTDDEGKHVKALLIDYSSKGALADRIYDECKQHYLGIPWRKRERWARQIIQGLADIHESGFVQGDLTLTNVVIDEKDDARIIDVNRRGCPLNWEPPEVKVLTDNNQRISLYVGVKSDLFQLGMVLWALAMEEDEPEHQGRPLLLGPEVNIPDWYRQITEICLSHDPRSRLQATQLLTMIPDPTLAPAYSRVASRPAVEQSSSPRELSGETARNSETKDSLKIFPTRGRSPPSPMPSDSSRQQKTGWAANLSIPASYDDVAARAKSYLEANLQRNSMPTPEYDLLSAQPTNLDRTRSREAERSFLDDASKASATPPASMSAVGPPKEVSYLPSADSGIFMPTINDETVLKLGSTAQPTTLTQTIHTELLNDLQCNGAAKSALQAILGLNGASSSTFTRDAAELDDNASVTAASWISRTSTPDGEMDGEMDGGAQLGRSDTAFSAIDTHFARPAYPDTSKPAMTTVIDTPVTTLENHFLHKPNGTLAGLGTGHGMAAPLLADLNPDIHFDSALWPDATRRFMTGAKS